MHGGPHHGEEQAGCVCCVPLARLLLRAAAARGRGARALSAS
jgi:hypothetical protein